MKTLAIWLMLATMATAQTVDYPVVAVRSVRADDNDSPFYPEVSRPYRHPVSDLVRINPDGTETVIVSGNGTDAIFDPKTIDGINVFFVRVKNCKSVNPQRADLPINGSDIYSINLATNEVTKWTDQAEAALPGFADPSKIQFGYGVMNLGPQPLPDGRLIFVSSRRRIDPTKSLTAPCLQLHAKHTDGSIECIGVMSQGSALHPELLRDGRIAFSSYESMGLRDQRIWSLWHIDPDGTNWGPLFSAYSDTSYHFHSQRTDGEICVTEYYNVNNDGFGCLLGIDEFPTYSMPDDLREIVAGYWHGGEPRKRGYKFAPSGLRNLIPWTDPFDSPSVKKSEVSSFLECDTVSGLYLGKVSHPSASPENGVLVCYSEGAVTRRFPPADSPSPHFEIRLLKKDVGTSPDDLIPLHKADGFNYTQPRALVSFREIYGSDPIAKPDKVDRVANYGVFGSSDAFTGQFTLDSGSTGGPRSILILGTEPNFAKTYGFDNRGRQNASGRSGWFNQLNERLRILGEYRFDEPDRPADDHSFRVKVPADVPFTVAIRGDDGRFVTCGMSWKQVRPGYQEINCGGCHNHAGEPISGVGKYAWRDDYVLKDFTGQWRIPEFHKDVEPILSRRCYHCHSAGLNEVLLDESIAANGSSLVLPARAAKSPISWRIHGENGVERMPLGEEPLTAEEIQIIDEWIDCGALVDHGQGAAFDVFDQVANPSPIEEAIPIGGQAPTPDPCDEKDNTIAEQAARIEELELKIQNAKEALE